MSHSKKTDPRNVRWDLLPYGFDDMTVYGLRELRIFVYNSDEQGRASLVPTVKKRISWHPALPYSSRPNGLFTAMNRVIDSGLISDFRPYTRRMFRYDGGYMLLGRVNTLALAGKDVTLSICHGKPRHSPDNGRLSLSYVVTTHGVGDA